jgi:hypothetical protein
MMTFIDLQDEVKRRATRDQSGSEFTTATKNAINFSLFRVARECPWRVLRREATITTETSYTTGTGAVTVTANSANFSVVGATFLTSGIKVGRLVKFGGSSKVFKLLTITSETAGTVDQVYDGTSSTTQTYEILPTSEYNLPVQAAHRTFLWHRQWGYPTQMQYMTEQYFRMSAIDDTVKGIPWVYRMWQENMVIGQPLQPSIVSITSSSASDTSGSVVVFGIVSGYPDYDTLTLNGTSTVNGTKSFSSIERVTKSAPTVGRVTVTTNSANNTVAVLPVGDTTGGVMYSKIAIWPLPDAIFPIQVSYYKDPYRLVNDNDIHEMGQEFDEALILMSVAKIKYETGQAEGDSFAALYIDEIKSLRRTNMDKPDWNPSLRRPSGTSRNNGLMTRGVGFMQMGGYYGPSSR